MKLSPVLDVTFAIVVLLAIIVYAKSGDDGGDELGSRRTTVAFSKMKATLRAKKKAEEKAAKRAKMEHKLELERDYQHATRLLNQANEEVEKYEDVIQNIKKKARAMRWR